MKLRALATCLLLSFPVVTIPQVRPRPEQKASSGPSPYMQLLKSYDQEGPVTKVVLKNNLTIVVAEAHATPLVEVMSWIKTGYADDPADLAGASRLVSQVLFRGTANRTALVMASDMKALGGEFQSTVEYNHTSFWTVAPAPQWKKLLELQADALLNPLFDPQELKRQAGLIADSSLDERQDPEELVTANLLATGIAGEGISKGRSVSRDALNKISREKLAAFYKSNYTTDRSLLVVCGDVLAADVLNAAATLFSPAKAVASPESRASGLEGASGLRYAQAKASEPLARLALGFRTAPANSRDYPAVEVLRAMLGTGEASILNRRLKSQKGLVADASASLYGSLDTGYLKLILTLDPNDLDRCEIAAFTELEILKKQAESNGELERARSLLMREFWETAETISGRTERLARFETLGSWKNVNSYLATLSQVKWADVKRVANRYLTLDNCAVVEVLPTQAEPRSITPEIIGNTIRAVLDTSAAQEISEREKATVGALEVPDEAQPFRPNSVRYPFQRASILRGPELMIREDHTMPVIHIGFFFAGGKLLEAKANAGITSLMLHTMLRDSQENSADSMYRQLEAYGGILHPVVEEDYFGIQLSVLSPYVEQALDIVSEMIKTPKFDAQEVARQKILQIATLRSRSREAAARRQLLGALFPDHSYALDPCGSEASIAGITRDAAQAWHKLYVADKKPMVVIIGDTQGTSLAAYFVAHFSGSRFEDAKLPDKFPASLQKPGELDVSSVGNASLLMVGFQALPNFDEDSFPLIVFRNHASGLAGRLTGAIQDRVPSARQLSVRYEPKLRAGAVIVRMTVSSQEEELAQKTIAEELQRILTSLLPYRDYRSALNTAVAEVQIRQQSRFCQIGDMIQSILAGKGLEGFEEFASRLQEVKQADLQDVAQRVFKIEKSVTLRVHGKS